jgi:hypothetical protein
VTGRVHECEGCGLQSSAVLDLSNEEPSKAFARAVGEELRRAREERGWSRARFVELLPSKIGGGTFRPMAQWAQNILNEHPTGVVAVEATVVRNLALFVGCNHDDLAKYLARFIPDNVDEPEPNASRPVTTRDDWASFTIQGVAFDDSRVEHVGG